MFFRYVNDSPAKYANCVMKRYINSSNEVFVALYALRNIKKGDELRYTSKQKIYFYFFMYCYYYFFHYILYNVSGHFFNPRFRYDYGESLENMVWRRKVNVLFILILILIFEDSAYLPFNSNITFKSNILCMNVGKVNFWIKLHQVVN